MNRKFVVRNRILAGVFALAVGSLPVILYAHSTGPDPRHTAAPGDDQLACATAGCHTGLAKGGPLNQGGGTLTATFSSGTTYIPGGSPVTVTVTVNDPANHLFGFQMTARPESNLAQGQAGHFVAPNSTMFVLCDDNVHIGTCPTTAPVEFIEHQIPSTTPWTFTWNPPATNVGPVHFYFAGNAANGNGVEDVGDHIYTNSFVLTPATSGCFADATPALTGVVTPVNFGARRDFSAGTWLEVYGSNISTSNRSWLTPDFNGNNAPTSLDNVRVTVNGKPAYTAFVNSGQINVQAPADTATGNVQVTVTNCDKTSNPITLTKNNVAPAILAPLAFVVNGKQLIGATLTDLRTFVGTIPNVTSRPVKPGETIVTYGVGFGATDDNGVPGVITTVGNHIVAPLSVTIGGVPVAPADIGYAGLSPNFVGLYQFNIKVPPLGDGDQVVMFKVDDVPLNQPTVYLSVKN